MVSKQVSRKLATALAVVLIAGASSIGGAAWATHKFSDVPDGSFFEPAISAGSDAGCFLGFSNGTFKSSNSATRGQFAFWLNNCASRANSTKGAGLTATGNGDTTLVTHDVGVAGSGTQFVHLTASVYVTAAAAAATGCTGGAPSGGCGVVLNLKEGATFIDSAAIIFTSAAFFEQNESVSLTGVVAAAAGTHNYSVVATGFGLTASGGITTGAATISAITAPFTADPPPL